MNVRKMKHKATTMKTLVKTFVKTSGVLAALTSVTSVGAAKDLSLCTTQHYQPDIISWIPENPSYFAKVLPDGQTATYIGAENRLLYLEEPDVAKRMKSIPGDVDPVPCPDGKILTVPGLSIYEMSTVVEKGSQATPIDTDDTLGGVYQSCAVLKKSGSKTTYRVVTDESGEVYYRDYLVEFSSRPRTPAKVTKLGQMAKRCPGLNLKTIIISKTGKYLSGYDWQSGTTKIFNIEGSDKACEQVLDLGYPTGKLEFNFDDTQVTFHVDYFGSSVGSYFSGVDSNLSKDVFTLDLDTASGKVVGKNLRRITMSNELGSGSYYPSFMRDGRLIYINDDGGFFSFQIIKPSDVSTADFALPPPDGWPGGTPPLGTPSDWKEKLHSAAVIGSLWAENCSNDPDEITAVQAASIRMGLSAATCRGLVENGWDALTAQRLSAHARFSRDTRFDGTIVKTLTKEGLEKVCGNAAVPPVKTPKVFGTKVLENLTGSRAVHHYCVGCHATGGMLRLPGGGSIPNPLDFRNLTEDQIQRAKVRLDLPAGQGRMPPNGFKQASGTGQDHKALVVDYLDCLLRRLHYTGDEWGRPICDN